MTTQKKFNSFISLSSDYSFTKIKNLIKSNLFTLKNILRLDLINC